MKKKLSTLLSMITVLCLILSLAACGGGAKDTATNPPATDAPAATDAPDATDAPAGEETPAAEGYNGESLTIKMSSTSFESEDQVAPMKFFAEKVEELSDGKITCTISWGGTEYDNAGTLDAMESGLLHMDFMLMNRHGGSMPLMMFGFMPYSPTAQDSIDQTNWILFENEETAAILEGFFNTKGMTILGNTCDGAPAFVTNFEWDTLDELVSNCSSFGTMNTAKYAGIGLSCSSVTGSEAYDSMSRGLVDGVSMPLGGAISNSMYEVATQVMVDGQYTSGVLAVANEKWYSELSDEAKAVIVQAIRETETFSAEHVGELTVAHAEAWEAETGTPVKYLAEEDAIEFWQSTLVAIADNSMKTVAGTEYESDMLTILTAWTEYQGVEWSWEG